MIDKPRGACMCRSSIILFFPILGSFVDDYSTFWGLMVVEPQGALTCRSSTPTDLADSGPFRGLLLTVLESQSDFHD